MILLTLIITPGTILPQVSGFHIPGDAEHSRCYPAPGMPCPDSDGGGGSQYDPIDVPRAVDEIQTAAVIILGVTGLALLAIVIKHVASSKSEPSYDTTDYDTTDYDTPVLDGAVRISGDTPKMFEKPKLLQDQ